MSTSPRKGLIPMAMFDTLIQRNKKVALPQAGFYARLDSFADDYGQRLVISMSVYQYNTHKRVWQGYVQATTPLHRRAREDALIFLQKNWERQYRNFQFHHWSPP